MFKNLIKNNKVLIMDNLILFVCMMILNLSGFIYHFYTGRVLGPADYGVIGALLSLIYFIIVPTNVIQTAATKFVAEYKAKKEFSRINDLFNVLLKKLFIYSIMAALIFILISPWIKEFLHINSLKPLIILSFFIILATLLPISRGILQGLQKFKHLGVNYILEGASKLILVFSLLYIGFRVNGAVAALAFSFLIPFLVAFFPLREFLGRKNDFKAEEVFKYCIPVLFTLVAITFIFSIDVILVKHYLSAVEAGYYAAIAILGKVIYFGCFSINQVMFSKVSELFANKQKTRHILNKSLMFVLLFTLPIIFIYFVFPGFIVKLLFGKKFLEIIPLIGWFAVFMTLITMTYLISFYNLAIHKNKFIYLLVIFNILELVLIVMYHTSLIQVINILIGLNIVLFLIMLIWTEVKSD